MGHFMIFISYKKTRLKSEINRLEQELSELSSNLSESQVGYKRTRLQQLKQELADMDKKQFANASDKLKQDMNQQDMISAISQSQDRD